MKENISVGSNTEGPKNQEDLLKIIAKKNDFKLPNVEGNLGKNELKRALTGFFNGIVLNTKGNEVVSHNLKMMETDMQKLSDNESVGGNAGTITIQGKMCSCMGLNGYADRNTGEILAFGNFQDIPSEIRKKGIEFTFRKAIYTDMKTFTGGQKIIDFFGAERFSDKGRENINIAINSYNAKY